MAENSARSEGLSEEATRVARLGTAVSRRRRELGLRQSELADLAGCSQRFVHTVEHGKTSLRLDKVLDVLAVLGLSLMIVPGRGQIGVAARSGPQRGAGE